MQRDDPYRPSSAFRDATHLSMSDLGLGQGQGNHNNNNSFSNADVQQALRAARAATSAGASQVSLTPSHSLGSASLGSWTTPPATPGMPQYGGPGHYSPYNALGSGGRKWVNHRQQLSPFLGHSSCLIAQLYSCCCCINASLRSNGFSLLMVAVSWMC